MISVRKVGVESIPVIRHLANIAWPFAYVEILVPQQLDYMMELIYSKTSLHKQMEKGQQFIVAYDEDTAIAFAAYEKKENNPGISTLHKIYTLPNQQGKGLGRLLINSIIADIKPATTLELNVNRKSRALPFYKKIGFKIIDQEDIDIGSGYFMNDYVMQLTW